VESDAGGGHSATTARAHAQAFAAVETALGLVRFLECSPTPYESSLVHLCLGAPICSAVSMLSTLPWHLFSLCLTLMHMAVEGQDN
jgi:hypothetical protein